MSEENKMILHLSQNDKGENEIWLDGKRLKNVVEYKIESTNPSAGVMLSLEVMVQLPEWRNLRK
jgi:PDZ domain-containing secreted protein